MLGFSRLNGDVYCETEVPPEEELVLKSDSRHTAVRSQLDLSTLTVTSLISDADLALHRVI